MNIKITWNAFFKQIMDYMIGNRLLKIDNRIITEDRNEDSQVGKSKERTHGNGDPC